MIRLLLPPFLQGCGGDVSNRSGLRWAARYLRISASSKFVRRKTGTRKKSRRKRGFLRPSFFFFGPRKRCVIAVAKIDSKGRIEVLVARSGTDAGRNGNGMRRIERSSAIIPYSMMAEANAG